MFGVDTEYLKRDILDYVNECVENYKDTRDKKYLYDLLDFCNWLIEVSKSIVDILKAYGIPIVSKEELERAGYKPIAELKAEPITIEIPEIFLKLPEEVKTKTIKVSETEYKTEEEET